MKPTVRFHTLVSISFLVGLSPLKTDGNQQAAPALTVVPERPYVEYAEIQRLNFDFHIQNASSQKLTLSRILLEVYDDQDALVLRKALDDNGFSPGILTIPRRDIEPGEVINVFNPFFSFSDSTPLRKLHYEFAFSVANSDDYVQTAVDIYPRNERPITNLDLPLKGRFLVKDGHDFYSHHRRLDLTSSEAQKEKMTGNGIRYASDFCVIDSRGQLFKGTPYTKENWYGYGARVYAPADGTVIEVENAIPENTFNEGKIVFPTDSNQRATMMGNHVILDHGHGEYSALLHLRPGSVRVKEKQNVKRGHLLGQIGFSGDSFFPHLHYMLMDGSDEFHSEGLPAYFRNFSRILGSKRVHIKNGVVDTGDILEVP